MLHAAPSRYCPSVQVQMKGQASSRPCSPSALLDRPVSPSYTNAPLIARNSPDDPPALGDRADTPALAGEGPGGLRLVNLGTAGPEAERWRSGKCRAWGTT